MKKIIGLAVILLVFLVISGLVYANPRYFSGKSAVATTTPVYMTRGTATTTPAIDSFTGTQGGVKDTPFLAQDLTLFIHMNE